jgi:AraC family transcriptional regulator of arabinose operon
MQSIEKWNIQKSIFRSLSDKHFDQSLSCGFINKSSYVKDITREHYQRLAMVYVLRGQGHYSDSMNISHPLNAGDVFFRCPDRLHSTTIEPDSQWLECYASVRSEWHQLLLSIGLMSTEKICFQPADQSILPQRLLRCMQKLEESDTPLINSNIEFEIVSLIRDILTQSTDSPASKSPQRDKLEAARAQIRLHATSQVNLENILKDIGIGYARIRCLFSQTYGISPGNYRIQVRIEQACALLVTSSKSIQEIADLLGYADAFTFSKQFKQRIGIAPRLFRERPG